MKSYNPQKVSNHGKSMHVVFDRHIHILSQPFAFCMTWDKLLISSTRYYTTFSESLYQNYNSVQFSSVAQSYPTLCNPMDCSTPGLPVHQQLPELAQTHVHWVSDAIHPSPPLSSPSPLAFTTYSWLLNCSLINYLLKENRKINPPIFLFSF